MLTLIDEYTRKCLAIRVGSSLKSDDVLATLSTLFITEGIPEYILQITVEYCQKLKRVDWEYWC